MLGSCWEHFSHILQFLMKQLCVNKELCAQHFEVTCSPACVWGPPSPAFRAPQLCKYECLKHPGVILHFHIFWHKSIHSSFWLISAATLAVPTFPFLSHTYMCNTHTRDQPSQKLVYFSFLAKFSVLFCTVFCEFLCDSLPLLSGFVVVLTSFACSVAPSFPTGQCTLVPQPWLFRASCLTGWALNSYTFKINLENKYLGL